MMKENEIKDFLERINDRETAVKKIDFPSLIPALQSDNMRVSIHYLEDIQVNITAELGSATMKIKDIIRLEEGAVIELEQPVGETAEIYINGQSFGRGEVVVIGVNFGIRMESIYKVEKKIGMVSES